MTTKEFIKMLKEADPSGNLHVRVGEGIPLFAEPKQGYWDGPYYYFDNDRNFVISVKGDKVDIHTTGYEEFIWDNDGDYSNIKFEGFDRYCDPEPSLKRYQETFDKISQECIACLEQSTAHFTKEVNEKLEEGWKIREDKSHGNWSKNMMNWVKGKKEKRMCVGECQIVHKYKADLFESYDEDDKFKFWRLK